MSRLEMDATTLARLSKLLDEALERAPAMRSEWVDALGQEFDALKPQLRDLLSRAATVETGEFLNTLPKIDPGADAPALQGVKAGDLIGPYRLLRELGAGGMGSVWLAERSDGLILRPIALKLPHIVTPRRAELAERMAREREILGSLDHRNIARLFDAGLTADGQPYLALEFVEGKPIDQYCRGDGGAPLPLDARLKLFLQVASAVAYAHGKLVVHRDLKPANILVGADGGVRLLDFGIAKLLDAGETKATQLTQLGGGAFTPDYASPEQILGEPLTVASDVYSLGVVLYELLSGARPYKLKRDSRGALEDAILQATPRRPSESAPAALRKALRGDLDTIVLKALKKNPDERYVTVNALLEDVRRFLRNEPVLARPDSRRYVLGKFVRRNRVAVAAAASMLLIILAGTGIALWQTHEARLQRIRANAEAEVARRSEQIARAQVELSDYLTSDLSLGRSTTEIERQLERAILFVNRQYRNDAPMRVRMLTELAARFRQTGDFKRHKELVGEIETEAVKLGEADVVSRIRCWRARDLSTAGRNAEARKLIAAEVAGLKARDTPTTLLTFCLALASGIERAAGNSKGSIEAIEEVARIELAAGLGNHDEHAETQFLLARAYSQAGRYREASRAADASARIHAAAGFDDSPGMANTQLIRGRVAREGGRPDLALKIFDDQMANHLKRGGDRGSMQVLEFDRGVALFALGRVDEALESMQGAFDNAQRRGDSGTAKAAAAALVGALLEVHQPDRARHALETAAGLFENARREKAYTARQYLFARAEYALALRDAVMATEALEEAREILAKLENASDPAWREYDAYRARVALLERKFPEARDFAGEALRLAEMQAVDSQASKFVAEALVLRATALRALGEGEAARADSKRALSQYRVLSVTEGGSFVLANTLASS
jgi:tetratricopeptide (TPR) repeat protein